MKQKERYYDPGCQLLGNEEEEAKFIDEMATEKQKIHELVLQLQQNLKDGISIPEFEATLQELNELTKEREEPKIRQNRELLELGSFLSVDDDIFYTPYEPLNESSSEKKSNEIVIVQDFATSCVVSRQRQLELIEMARNFK